MDVTSFTGRGAVTAGTSCKPVHSGRLEFGRRPQITAANAGREHWPFCYSALLAGGGIGGGMVYGASDAHAAYPASDPVSPQDFGTTIIHALGMPTDAMLADREGRPHRITSGKVIQSLFA